MTQSETYSSRPCRVSVFTPRSPVMIAVIPRSLSQANSRRSSARSTPVLVESGKERLDRVQDDPARAHTSTSRRFAITARLQLSQNLFRVSVGRIDLQRSFEVRPCLVKSSQPNEQASRQTMRVRIAWSQRHHLLRGREGVLEVSVIGERNRKIPLRVSLPRSDGRRLAKRRNSVRELLGRAQSDAQTREGGAVVRPRSQVLATVRDRFGEVLGPEERLGEKSHGCPGADPPTGSSSALSAPARSLPPIAARARTPGRAAAARKPPRAGSAVRAGTACKLVDRLPVLPFLQELDAERVMRAWRAGNGLAQLPHAGIAIPRHQQLGAEDVMGDAASDSVRGSCARAPAPTRIPGSS